MGSAENMIDHAVEVAASAHRGQFRKGTAIPYISHPYAVALILSRAGCPDELIVAGILHDIVEDTELTLEYIRENFGQKIAAIVEGCSEPDKSLSWEQRKTDAVKFLKTASSELRTVACADKLHNLRRTIVDYQKIGEAVWERFNRGKQAQECYYRELVSVFGDPPGCQAAREIFQEFNDAVGILFGPGECS